MCLHKNTCELFSGVFLQACAYEFCHEFVRYARKLDYKENNVSISSVITASFASNVCHLNEKKSLRLRETLYYISGWTICATKKVAERRNQEFADILIYFPNFVAIDAVSARKEDLPTGKVDRVCAFGSLIYPAVRYFNFVTRIEEVFANVLSHEYLIVYGSFLLNKIKGAFLLDNQVLEYFFEFLPTDSPHF